MLSQNKKNRHSLNGYSQSRFLSLLVLFCLRLYVPVNNFSVLSNWDEVSCSRTQHRAPGEDRTRDLAIESDALPTELLVLPSSFPVGARLFVQQHV